MIAALPPSYIDIRDSLIASFEALALPVAANDVIAGGMRCGMTIFGRTTNHTDGFVAARHWQRLHEAEPGPQARAVKDALNVLASAALCFEQPSAHFHPAAQLLASHARMQMLLRRVALPAPKALG